VRSFGQKAWENVQAVRSGGNFTSIENFCERVNMRVVNLKVLRMLIASGAMDSLEQNRASMDAVVTQLQRRMRERQEEAGAEKLQGELFDLEHWGEGSEAEPAEKVALQEWNHWERLQREYEALGFYLAIDPLRRYKIVLDHLKPMQIEHLSGKMAGKSLRVVGLTGIHESEGPLIAQPGSVLLDLEGIPVFLSPPLARICGYCLEPGTEVLVTGRLTREHGFACLIAEDCANRVDDDGDGRTDCHDSDCADDPGCLRVESNCADALDDDGDGSTDCEDHDCAADPACLTEADCANRADDDGDGQVDCLDSDCERDVACAPDEDGRRLLRMVVDRLGMSARTHDRILKVARTIADLEGSPRVRGPHVAEAVQYRVLDRKVEAA
jgi:hypothetical protein